MVSPATNSTPSIGIREAERDVKSAMHASHAAKPTKAGKEKGSVKPPKDKVIEIDDGKFTLTKVSELCLTRFKPDPKIPNPPLGNPIKFVARQRAILMSCSDGVKRRTAFELLIKAEEELKTKVGNDVIDRNTCVDFDLVCDHQGNLEGGIAALITKYASTEVGKAYILGLMARPTSDYETLLKRQNFIKALTESDNKTVAALREQFKDIADDELQFLSMWESKMQVPGCVNKQYMEYQEKFDEYAKKTPLILDINATCHTSQKVTGTATKAVSSVVLPIAIFATAATAVGLMSASGPNEGFLNNYTAKFLSASGSVYTLLNMVPSTAVKVVAVGLAGLNAAVEIRNTVYWNIADLKAEAIVQNKLVNISHLYRRIKSHLHYSQRV